MAKRLSTQNAFFFNEGGVEYAVVLCGLRNDVNGNRRYEATVVDLNDLMQDDRASGAFRYRFTGHCACEREEAEFALRQLHLKS